MWYDSTLATGVTILVLAGMIFGSGVAVGWLAACSVRESRG